MGDLAHCLLGPTKQPLAFVGLLYLTEANLIWVAGLDILTTLDTSSSGFFGGTKQRTKAGAYLRTKRLRTLGYGTEITARLWLFP